MKIVAVSGYFNPLHIGHINYLFDAAELGDKLIVIINNDKQVDMKGSSPFQTEEERAQIIASIKCVDETVIAIDTDGSVCNTLAYLEPDVFAKGGDRTLDNIPEKDICRELGIKMVFGCGGDKIQSSSTLIQKALRPYN